MNWIKDYVRPKLQKLTAENKNAVAENLWQKCPSCEQMLFHRDLVDNLSVCHYCNHHLRLNAHSRLKLLFDNEEFTPITLPKTLVDPLKFKDSKKYVDRLKEYRKKTGQEDAIIVAHGKIGGFSAVVAAFDFSFMGGSMGLAVGAALVAAAELAIKLDFPLITIPASGGARMQEGPFSLMQMPRSTVAVQMMKDAGLPYLVLLVDPTLGGVSASFAMLGDVTLAESGATIGFTGARVIQQTIKEKLPSGFQTAEYLQQHGMIDMVVHRKDLRATFKKILGLLKHRSL